MGSENANTVQIQAYTPDGFRVYVNVELVPANELDMLLKENGYLANAVGAKAGETIETVTHVCRRMHTSKKDGGITPMLAFYLENVGMTWKYDFMYFNTPEQIAEFEALSGMKLFDIPEYESDTWAGRDNAKAAKYIIQMPNPIKVAARDEPYTFGKETGMTKKIQRFIDTPVTSSPTQITPEQWNTEVLRLTATLYEHVQHQRNSLKKAQTEGAISMKLSPEAAFEVMLARKQAAQEGN